MEELRGCRKDEFEETMNLLNLVFCTSRGLTPFMLEKGPHVYNAGNLENMRIIKVDGKIVSHAAIYEREIISRGLILKTGAIGGVATHPDFRSHGYSTLILKDCLKKMEQENYDISILWSGSPDFYRRLGWETAGQSLSFQVDKGNFFLLPLLAGAVESAPKTEDYRQIKKLHEKEAFRVARSRAEYPLLFSIPERKIFLAKRNEGISAYLLLDKDGLVLEYGGETKIVAALLRDLLEKGTFTRLNVTTPAVNNGLPEYLRDSGIPGSVNYLGMIRVINREGIWKKLKKRKRAMPDLNKLSKLLFGPEVIAPGFTPVPLYWWRSEYI